MEMVFSSSPEHAQEIVKYLQDPNYFPCDINYSAAYFVGNANPEKIITAKAIAYKMAQKGWKSEFISSDFFSRKYRNQTAIELRDELKRIESSNQPTIVIIEDLNKLFENGYRQYDDAEMTGSVLSAFLDKNIRNKNIFLISTMNRANKLPKGIKSRMIMNIISFDSKTNSDNL